MLGPELFLLFTKPLDELELDYLVTGSVASILYGEPRLTHDIDIVLGLTANDASKLVKAFPLESFYCPPTEIIQIEARRSHRGHFNIIHHETGYKADIYIKDNQPLHRWALEHRRPVKLSNGTLWVAPPEYVILRKLEYFREGGSEKHLRDIRGMIDVSGDEIDETVMDGWVEHLHLEKEWNLSRKPSS